MYVELGNRKPVVCAMDSGSHLGHVPLDTNGAPAVTYVHVPEAVREDGSQIYGWDPEADLNALARHLLQAPDGITRAQGHEALLAFVHPNGLVGHHHGEAKPSWVRSDNAEFAKLLATWYECPVLGDDDSVEDTHLTVAGPPGVVPGARLDLQANITQNGRDMWARGLGGGQVGAIGAGTAATATTLTTASTYTTNQWAGCRVFVYSTTSNNIVFGIVVSNTNAAGASVLTVDRWYVVATPGQSSAGTTPTTPWAFVIMDGNAPAWYMGLTTDTATPASPATDTSLPSEITTSGGGLIRQICPYAHTASANTYTLTPVYTANGSDSLPAIIAKIGVFDSMVVGDTTSTMLFETKLGTTATLSLSGDQLTITETVTGT